LFYIDTAARFGFKSAQIGGGIPGIVGNTMGKIQLHNTSPVKYELLSTLSSAILPSGVQRSGDVIYKLPHV
jgi:hypothetical protein